MIDSISYFSNIAATIPVGETSICSLLQSICIGGKDGNLRRAVEEIRRHPDDKKARTILKRRTLPVITWQGTFSERNNAGLIGLSGLMCIDIDHKSPEELDHIRVSLTMEPWCVAYFLSPSGDGLKVIVLTDNYDPGAYKGCYKQLEALFQTAYGTKPDNSCEPLSQGCFASYDPGLYYNPQATPLHLEPIPEDSAQTSQPSSAVYTPKPVSFFDALTNNLDTAVNGVTDEKIIEILHRKFKKYPQNYMDGHRTKSVFVQAAMLCKAGIPQAKSIIYLRSQFEAADFPADKVIREASNAYAKTASHFSAERGQYLSYPNYLKSKAGAGKGGYK